MAPQELILALLLTYRFFLWSGEKFSTAAGNNREWSWTGSRLPGHSFMNMSILLRTSFRWKNTASAAENDKLQKLKLDFTIIKYFGGFKLKHSQFNLVYVTCGPVTKITIGIQTNLDKPPIRQADNPDTFLFPRKYIIYCLIVSVNLQIAWIFSIVACVVHVIT